MAKKPEPSSPFTGIGEYDIDDASAIQAFVSGRDVPAYVAKRVWSFIVNTLAATYDQSYRPEKPHDTSFVEGRRFVGLQMVKLSKIDLTQFRRQHERTGTRSSRRPASRDPGRNPGSESKPG